MTLTAFLFKNRLRISPASLSACEYALRNMHRSLDPLHNHLHIYSMLESLHSFINADPNIKSQIDFDVLLVAICWHDVWKSGKNPRHKRAIIFHNLAEGLAAMRLFSRYAKIHPLPKVQVKKINYAIRKHSAVQILPKRTLEARILKDLDALEMWSFSRIANAVKHNGGVKNIPYKLFLLFSWYFSFWQLRRTTNNYYLDWSKNEFLIRRRQFLIQLSAFLDQLIHPHPNTSSLLRDKKSNQLSITRKIILKGLSSINSTT
ncbi:MAG: hypothetical protein ACD_13C00047G0001 [uncultured bacterium]|uniref:HD domain-containing protein n=3 Tax=Candidatus Amesiibacteriota TaxID=1752730 RepID=A0A1F4Z4P7_9BACT|nr:MAG: hypothetical protein ACD_13C00047G0001 [uncultured bacterium]KKU56015.1 MAG: hypothetical protein UX78_C0013G0011 [Candidatus Amesbacteria bacterium GW2011_GWA2_47_11]OGD01141.1 MAG: hypothetical protein A3E17_00820 [Candidatus Amesbacteria bacterium RIFCSPHIGHO2_12_FULL_48_14]OGD12178.1 MAG: hypothetical protein A2576_04795 [Candidatus Amesbacteria bacterium RIFOXYD1_FULL_47_9]